MFPRGWARTAFHPVNRLRGKLPCEVDGSGWFLEGEGGWSGDRPVEPGGTQMSVRRSLGLSVGAEGVALGNAVVRARTRSSSNAVSTSSRSGFPPEASMSCSRSGLRITPVTECPASRSRGHGQPPARRSPVRGFPRTGAGCSTATLSSRICPIRHPGSWPAPGRASWPFRNARRCVGRSVRSGSGCGRIRDRRPSCSPA